MSRAFTPKVVTANALLEGDVVYLTVHDQWSRRLAEAEIITDEAHAQIRQLDGEMRSGEVVGVYLAEVKLTDAGPIPAHFREDFRASGPSNYAHGKKWDQNHV